MKDNYFLQFDTDDDMPPALDEGRDYNSLMRAHLQSKEAYARLERDLEACIAEGVDCSAEHVMELQATIGSLQQTKENLNKRLDGLENAIAKALGLPDTRETITLTKADYDKLTRWNEHMESELERLQTERALALRVAACCLDTNVLYRAKRTFWDDDDPEDGDGSVTVGDVRAVLRWHAALEEEGERHE